jgi:phenylalanyl-tRNA synthetase beta chain
MMPRGAAELLPDPAAQTIEARVRIALAASGLDEVVNYSFVAPKDLEVLSPGEQPIPLKNPLAAEQSVMCTTRLAGLLTNLRRSRNRQVEDVRLYEIGRIYLRPSGGDQRQPANEPRMLAGVMYGARAPLQWGEPRAPIDFYDLKGAVEQVLEAACVRGASFAPGAANDVLHPRSACEVRFGGKLLGTLGELHPAAAQKLDLPRGVYVFELDFDALVAAAQLVPQYQAVPRFPAVLRDLAVAVDEAVPAASVEETIRQAGGGLVEEVVLFDLYRGEKIAAGKKSLAFAIRYRASGRTLTDEEANKAHALIVARLSERYGAELRA